MGKRTSSGKSCTVLVADDDDNIRALLRTFLTGRPGLRVFEAASGIEAVEVLLREPAQLLVLDLHMPGMNGLEVTSFVRANPSTRGATILMFTSETDVRTRRKALRLGVDYYISKPFDPREFDRVLDGLLEEPK